MVEADPRPAALLRLERRSDLSRRVERDVGTDALARFLLLTDAGDLRRALLVRGVVDVTDLLASGALDAPIAAQPIDVESIFAHGPLLGCITARSSRFDLIELERLHVVRVDADAQSVLEQIFRGARLGPEPLLRIAGEQVAHLELRFSVRLLVQAIDPLRGIAVE